MSVESRRARQHSLADWCPPPAPPPSQDAALVDALLAAGQAHVFADWPKLGEREEEGERGGGSSLFFVRFDQPSPLRSPPSPGTDDPDKRRLLAQLAHLHASYSDGGLPGYVRNAARLLADSAAGANPFEGVTPSVPAGEAFDYASPAYRAAETRGATLAARAGFVLVAGGLGERLGYSGIKVALPADTARGACFLQVYVESVLALQDRAPAGTLLPIAIMTSDDTHAPTAALLEANGNFGAADGQITLLKQEKVACLADGAAALALDPRDRFTLLTKPHGHGDVHALMHATGTAARWARDYNTEWVCFFQDTNAAAFRGLLPALAVAADRGFAMASVCVPRRAGEAIGAIATLTPTDAGDAARRPLTINVEYNVLDPLLRATSPDGAGDVDDPATGFSPFPGNINELVVAMPPYLAALASCGGVVGEFVNPKYADATRTAFKAPTRLECMMQDLPHALDPSLPIGFCVVNQVWAAYSPVKNALADAVAKAAAGAPTHSAAAAEADSYKAARAALAAVGVAVPPSSTAAFKGIPVDVGVIAAWSPRWALTIDDVAARLPTPAAISLASPTSSLVIQRATPAVTLRSLSLDGALVVDAAAGVTLTVDGLVVSNEGWKIIELSDDKPAPEELRMRGFKLCKRGTLTLAYDVAGEYVEGEAQVEERELVAA